MDCCCARAEARRDLPEVILDLVDARLAVLSLVRLKIVETSKAGAHILVGATVYALGRRVSFDGSLVGDQL